MVRYAEYTLSTYLFFYSVFSVNFSVDFVEIATLFFHAFSRLGIIIMGVAIQTKVFK